MHVARALGVLTGQLTETVRARVSDGSFRRSPEPEATAAALLDLLMTGLRAH